MVPAIGSRTNAKIVTAWAAGLALTLASKAGPGPAPSGHPPGELVSQAGQLAVDAPVAPARVILRHLQHQGAYRLRRARPSRSAVRVRPPSPDHAGVPAQHVRGETIRRI